VASHIAREIFSFESPFDPSYEFFLVGGKKMSSSKGNAAPARDIAELLPPHIFRLALLGKDPRQQINFDPSGDAVPLLFDWYDRIAEKTWSGVIDDDSRLFTLVHLPKEQATIPIRYLPRFSLVSFIIQMPHLSLEKEIETMKGSSLTDEDRIELALRARYARYWLTNYAPEDYRFELAKTFPDTATNLSADQKESLREVLTYVENNNVLDGQEFHTALHGIRKGKKLDPQEFFSMLYLITLGKSSGPKAGWFLSVLPRDFLIQRLKEASAPSL
jgi:lysyl-tRNA synthetase class 1